MEDKLYANYLNWKTIDFNFFSKPPRILDVQFFLK